MHPAEGGSQVRDISNANDTEPETARQFRARSRMFPEGDEKRPARAPPEAYLKRTMKLFFDFLLLGFPPQPGSEIRNQAVVT